MSTELLKAKDVRPGDRLFESGLDLFGSGGMVTRQVGVVKSVEQEDDGRWKVTTSNGRAKRYTASQYAEVKRGRG